MRGWPLGPPAPVDPDVLAWVDEVDAALDAHDLERLLHAQAVLAMPRADRPPAPGVPAGDVPAPAVVEADPVVEEVLEQPPVVPAPPPAALAAPADGRRRGAWARRATC